MRKVGAKLRFAVPLWQGFFEGNLDTRFLTTLGLLRRERSGNCCSIISIVNQLKKGGVHVSVTVEI